MSTLSELEAKARAATPGPWWRGSWGGSCHLVHEGKGWHPGPPTCVYDPVRYEADDVDGSFTHTISSDIPMVSVAGNYNYEDGGIIEPKDAAFIAAWNPATAQKVTGLLRAYSQDHQNQNGDSPCPCKVCVALEGEL